MEINWFTFIAQIINFLVLMWLLKRFLYKPILSAIDERETKIKNQLLDAESQKRDAAKEKDEFKVKNETFSIEKDALMQKAAEEAKAEGDRLKENARHEANNLKDELEKAFTKDQAVKNKNMAKRIGDEVLDITRKTLIDLSSANLEEQTLEVFLKKMKGLDGDEKVRFLEALKGSKSILVQSAFPLSTNQQASIKKSLKELFEKENSYEFKVQPELINGIEILANGYKLSWSISDYLKSFEDHAEPGKALEI
ncbi:F0F1 ATP synthase subunit delta [Algibacter sp. L1A34]|uniref:F0F1 ATP synthase subunit delta n=1 Tax=Algibacter sp. L1A34 TaxID=2686365 RepID=UPI00131AF68F|nr:F0F1 ATP synthase subunit delta [Algibacter sp. L1A34]